MATVIMQRVKQAQDAEVSRKVLAFLEKMQEDHTRPGLHIEPIHQSLDPKVRTGRVDDFWRAVLFDVTGGGDPAFVYIGTFQHDDAIERAKRSTLRINPVNGVAELRFVESTTETPPSQPEPEAERHVPPPHEAPSLLGALGMDRTALVDELGLDADLADRALAAATEAELAAVADAAVIPWQGLTLYELASGTPLSEVQEIYGLDQQVTDSDDIQKALAHPAAQAAFAWVEDDAELRAAIESPDADAWRLFLHPAQRVFAKKSYNGPFKLSGGAGTGKTVVVVHRARNLAKKNPAARILVTTYTTNLAESLSSSMRTLDRDLPLVNNLGLPGVRVTGIDACARAVVREAGASVTSSVEAVLGVGREEIGGVTPSRAWQEAITTAAPDLPETLLSPTFFADEYDLVVLPNRITAAAEYLRVRRPGRGYALNRTKRAQVWAVIEAYRAFARANNSIDFSETAAIAAEWLTRNGPLADHVLIDEGQDLKPTHWQMLRAIVGEHPNDMFIAEDSHQRIYGQPTRLGHFGIKVVGRSRRLKLNYRTTAENLGWAMRVLDGGEYTDLDGADEEHGYRSARRGPQPILLPATGLADELTQAAELIQSWIAEGVQPEQIAVLVRTGWQRDQIVNGLAERGLKVRSVDRDAIKPGQPVVLTMHRAKGTEFHRVLLFGVQEGSIPAAMREAQYDEVAEADAMLRERSLLYVAGSRARDVLAITWAGDRSPLLPS